MFTAVQGPNGSGKTPIMKGVIQGLGHEVDLPPDVMTRCQFAETTLMVDGRPVTLTRRLGTDFDIRVSDGPDQKTFTSQAEYARWFVSLLNSEPPTLTNKQNQEAELYATVLLPALWVDQDHGWTMTIGPQPTVTSSKISERKSSDFSRDYPRAILFDNERNLMKRKNPLKGPNER